MKTHDEHFPILSPELVQRLDVPGPRYTSYPTVPEWGDLGSADAEAALAAAGAAADPLSLYVHIPFCKEMCTYCGCHVIVAQDPAKADAYLELVRREAQLTARALGGRHPISRVHLGGGTPTFLDERQLSALYATLAESFRLLPDAELAIEVDPAVTRGSQLALLAGFGWRRISMGLQDLDPDVQEAVKRVQTEEETRAAIDLARGLGFTSVNLDLIYGLPRQTKETWRRTIERVVTLNADRISLFSFAYVPTVKPHQRRLHVADIPTGETKLELFRLAHDTLVDSGYRAIGMDHFALASDELSTAKDEGRLWRDFQGYNAGRGGAGTIALGVSGIGDVGGRYLQNVKTLPRYAAALEAGQLPVEKGLHRSAEDDLRRLVIGQLMCNLRAEVDPVHFAGELGRLTELERDGLCKVDGGRVEVTPLGRVFVRNIAMVFDSYLQQDVAQRPRFSRTV